jgi:DNA-binding transcriptional MerR regulator
MSSTDGKEFNKKQLDKPILAASDLRNLAGLSYRQLNEWDKREALPHERKGDTGWRRMNTWQAIALRIISDLHRQFGIPLAKLSSLLHWMLGNAPTQWEQWRLLRAEDTLWDFPDEEKEKHNKKLKEALKYAKRLDNGTFLVSLNGTTTSKETKQSEASKDLRQRAQAWIDALTAGVVPRLAARGWATGNAEVFARRFFSLSANQQFGAQCASEILTLLSEAQSARDAKATRAVELLGSTLFPLLGALGTMTIGFPVFLMTDLEQSYFIDELSYIDWIRQDLLPKTALVLQINDSVNKVLQAANGRNIPVKLRAADLEQNDGIGLAEKERQVLDLLRQRDFDRLIVEPKGGGYRIEVQRDLSAGDEQEIMRILAEHEYQSVTIKKNSGKIVRISQSISIMTRSPDDGKTPTRRLKKHQ